jgi:hypothetical protein
VRRIAFVVIPNESIELEEGALLWFNLPEEEGSEGITLHKAVE